MVDSHNTQLALLFPLKAGLLAMKSTYVTRSAERIKKQKLSKQSYHNDRLYMRRGSSMSEIDKLSAGNMPDLVRSSTANNQLSASPASVPHSPYLSRSVISNTPSIRGSIGDLMNQKKYGSSQWSIRSETIIARTVPLSTVTPRHSPPGTYEESMEDTFDIDEVCGPLTVAQRTQRLSKLLSKQKATLIRREYSVRF